MSPAADASRNHPSMLLISAGKNNPAELMRVLCEAGYQVESIRAKSVPRRNTRRPGGARKPGLESHEPSILRRNLTEQPESLRTTLKACLDLVPEIQTACLAFFDPAHNLCRKYLCLGKRARAVPVSLSWEQFPILRLAFERKKTVYLPDATLLPHPAFWGGRSCGSCLAIPLQRPDPTAVLLLSHDRDTPLDAHQHTTLLLLARAMETILDNAVLRGELSVSETRYRSILSAAPFLIALLDQAGAVKEINPKALRELRRQGFSARKAIGLNLAQTASIPEEVRRLVQECLQKGEAVTREQIAIPLPRGPEVFRIHALPLHGRSSPDGEVLVIAEMITRYQQLTDDAERTERLAAIGRVAASLAHEINNPLQALRSHLELIRSYPLSEEEREVERLDETTRRVLGFARPAPDILQPVPITGVLEQALALSQNYLHNQHVEILTDLPLTLPPVLAAPGQLIQVFLNIILNAAHAMQGNGRLELRARSLGDRVEILFSNNGPPIPSEYLARIFDPFFTTRAEGTGLGLSISHAILQRHHGTIRAANLPHRKGVIFTITLPFHTPAGAIG